MRAPFWEIPSARLYLGDTREVVAEMEPGSVQTVVTSPPYFGLRDYGADGQLGLEEKPEEYIAHTVDVFREVRRVLRKDGTLWLNIGDSYAGSWGAQGRSGSMAKRSVISSRQIGEHPQFETRTGARGLGNGVKPKDLVGIPWMLAFALRADGWWLRQDIIWHKPNPMPESVTDRCTKAHEYVFLLTKASRYYFDAAAIAERSINGGRVVEYADARNKRSVWTIPVTPLRDEHYAAYPEALVRPCILAGSKPGDVVLDPFIGSGTTAKVARDLGRVGVGVDLNPDYLAMAARRIGPQMTLGDVS